MKQAAFNAGNPVRCAVAPVTAFWGVQPAAKLSGTIGFVIPSVMP